MHTSMCPLCSSVDSFMNTVTSLLAAALVSGLSLGAHASVVPEDDKPGAVNLAILDILHERGLIDDATYNELAAVALAELAENEAARGPANWTPPASSGPTLVLNEKGASVRSQDGELIFNIGGRIQADATAHSRNTTAGNDITDGTTLRRARFELDGEMPGGWYWWAQADFAGNGTSLKDFAFGNTTEGGTRVIFGHQKQPFSHAIEQSSNDISFVERGVDTYLLLPFVDRAIGVRAEVPLENGVLAAGIFGEGVGNNPVDDEGWGAVARIVHAPIQNDEEVLFFAARGAVRAPSASTSSVRIRDETTMMSNFSVVDTGVITDVTSTRLSGVEGAWASGPVTVQGEYNHVDMVRNGPDAQFTSWHVQTTVTLTGEARAKTYRTATGEFGHLGPDNPAEGFDMSKGAWEVAARVANIDLNDGLIAGGEETAASLSLIWSPTSFARFMLDLTTILNTRGGSNATRQAEGLDIATVRGQLVF